MTGSKKIGDPIAAGEDNESGPTREDYTWVDHLAAGKLNAAEIRVQGQHNSVGIHASGGDYGAIFSRDYSSNGSQYRGLIAGIAPGRTVGGQIRLEPYRRYSGSGRSERVSWNNAAVSKTELPTTGSAGDIMTAFNRDSRDDRGLEQVVGVWVCVKSSEGAEPAVWGRLGFSEYVQATKGSWTEQSSRDTDDDGVSDAAEILAGTDPLRDPRDAPTDDDGDGLIDQHELSIGTDPLHPDTDRDGDPDGVEVDAGSDPKDPRSRPI